MSEPESSTPTAADITQCDGWSLVFNSFSAGQDWGRKNPEASMDAIIDACSKYADASYPHEHEFVPNVPTVGVEEL